MVILFVCFSSLCVCSVYVHDQEGDFFCIVFIVAALTFLLLLAGLMPWNRVCVCSSARV